MAQMACCVMVMEQTVTRVPLAQDASTPFGSASVYKSVRLLPQRLAVHRTHRWSMSLGLKQVSDGEVERRGVDWAFVV